MDIIETKVEISLNNCVEMMKYNPATRLGYWLAILSAPFLGLYGYYEASVMNRALAKDAEHLVKLNNNYLIAFIVFSFILLGIILFTWKFVEKFNGKVLFKFHKKNNAMFLNIRFNKETRKFIFSGKEQDKYHNYSKIKIFSTPNNYIFYIGKGLYPGKFFLPKKGDVQQTLVVQEIIDVLHNEENIPIITKNK